MHCGIRMHLRNIVIPFKGFDKGRNLLYSLCITDFSGNTAEDSVVIEMH